MENKDYEMSIRPTCNFITCIAGMGVAGVRRCVFHGRWWWHDCPEYRNEDEYLEEWQSEELNKPIMPQRWRFGLKSYDY